MKHTFIQPRFDGSRFSEQTLPVEVAKDLVAYEALVVDLAKHLYLQNNPERQRVPKGFAADFHLHIEKIDAGSAKPLLCLVAAGALFAPGADGNVYFERARDLITECVAAQEDHLPAAFPRKLLSHFNQLGRSLRPDERLELPDGNGSVGVLTPERRKKLVLAAESVYEREFELSGTIGEADWEKSTFRLRLPDNSQAVIPMHENFHAQARLCGGRSRDQITVKGVGAYDSWDRLQKVVSVESLDVQPDIQLSGRLDALLEIEDGWLDGKGTAPDKSRLREISERMVGHYPEQIQPPVIVPTPEGNLLFEWNVPGDPSVDLNLKSMQADFHAFLPDESELEQVFHLTNTDQWGAFFAFLNQNLERYYT